MGPLRRKRQTLAAAYTMSSLVVDEAGGGTDPASPSSGANCVSMVSNAAGRRHQVRASVMGTTCVSMLMPGVSMLLVDVVSLPRRLGQPRRSWSSMNLTRASAVACWLTSPARAMIASSRSPTSGGCAIRNTCEASSSARPASDIT